MAWVHAIAGGGGPGMFISNGGSLMLDTVLNEGGAATHSDTLVVDGTSVGAAGRQRFPFSTPAARAR